MSEIPDLHRILEAITSNERLRLDTLTDDELALGIEHGGSYLDPFFFSYVKHYRPAATVIYFRGRQARGMPIQGPGRTAWMDAEDRAGHLVARPGDAPALGGR